MFMSRLFLYFTLFSFLCNATFADDAKYLDKGAVAPFSGYLIDQSKADKIRNMTIDLDSSKRVNILLNEENDVLKQRITNSRDENTDLAKRITDMKDSTFLGKVGFFVLGAAITGAIAYGTAKAMR
jgi:hypothetical protein